MRKAVSLGGDADTLACITGGIAEVFNSTSVTGPIFSCRSALSASPIERRMEDSLPGESRRVIVTKTLPTLLLALLVAAPVAAQQPTTTDSLVSPVTPYRGLSLGVGIGEPVSPFLGSGVSETSRSSDYLGRLSTNPYHPDSTSNRFGRFGSRYSPSSINNRLGRYGSRFSSNGVTNSFATETPKLFGNDGTYLGKLSTNPYNPESIANPYGRYGSRYSPDSVNNPYGRYGSRFSPLSPSNPYTVTPPLILGVEP